MAWTYAARADKLDEQLEQMDMEEIQGLEIERDQGDRSGAWRGDSR